MAHFARKIVRSEREIAFATAVTHRRFENGYSRIGALRLGQGKADLHQIDRFRPQPRQDIVIEQHIGHHERWRSLFDQRRQVELEARGRANRFERQRIAAILQKFVEIDRSAACIAHRTCGDHIGQERFKRLFPVARPRPVSPGHLFEQARAQAINMHEIRARKRQDIASQQSKKLPLAPWKIDLARN